MKNSDCLFNYVYRASGIVCAFPHFHSICYSIQHDLHFNTDDKNFGFIAVNDTKYFCHFRYGLFQRVFFIFVPMRVTKWMIFSVVLNSNVLLDPHDPPTEGSKVEFVLENTGRGLSAIDVTAIGGGYCTGSRSKGGVTVFNENEGRGDIEAEQNGHYVDSKVVQSSKTTKSQDSDSSSTSDDDHDDDSESDDSSDSDSSTNSSETDDSEDDDNLSRNPTSNKKGASAPAVVPGKITGTVVYIIYFTSCLVISIFPFKLFVIRL